MGVSDPFHAGEVALQRRAGSFDDAQAIGRSIRASVPAGASRFLARQRFAVASSVDPQGHVWASPLTGPPGFIAVASEQMLFLAARPVAGDPLAADIEARPELGLLVLDPRTRQRMRFNGRGLLAPEGIFLLADQVYGNCPKYIQRRDIDQSPPAERPAPVQVSDFLTSRQQDWIRRSDTFFIASFHPQGGADASHRGGFPGFARVKGPRRVAFEDYPGNGMFNTLGNLIANPSCGLLFVDFDRGHMLQLAGRARVAEDFSVEVDVDQVRETAHGFPLRWTFVEYSPSIPIPSHARAGRHPKDETGETRPRRNE